MRGTDTWRSAGPWAVTLAILGAGCGRFVMLPDNATFLDGAVTAGARKTVEQLQIPRGTTVAVVNVENPLDIDVQPNAKLYDAMVKEVLAAGGMPVERDQDVLARIANEAREALPLSATTGNEGPGRPFAWDGRVECRQSGLDGETAEPVLMVAKKTEEHTDAEGNRTVTVEQVPIVPKLEAATSIPAAQKILAYRVKECGIRYAYDSGDEHYARQGLRRRNARVALAARFVDARSGHVDGAVEVDETVHDYVPSAQLGYLEGHLYKDFNHLHPSVKALAGVGPGTEAADPAAAERASLSEGGSRHGFQVGGGPSRFLVQYVHTFKTTGIVAHKFSIGATAFPVDERDEWWDGSTWREEWDSDWREGSKIDYGLEFIFSQHFMFELKLGLFNEYFAPEAYFRFRFNENFGLMVGGGGPVGADDDDTEYYADALVALSFHF